MRKSISIAIAALAVGCAHYPAPNDQIARSMAAVRGAEEAGAAQVPEAALQLKLAQEEIEQSRKLVEKDDNLRAEDKARRAAQDAELAVAIAHDHTAQGKLDQFNSNHASGGEAPSAQGATP